jgi:hypothetical protein
MKVMSQKLDALGARSRRDVLIAGAALVTAPFIQTETAAAQGGQTPAPAVGRMVGRASYGGDNRGQRHPGVGEGAFAGAMRRSKRRARRSRAV